MKKIITGFAFVVPCLYWALHIYFAILAFSSFKLWFALAVTLIPIGGVLLFLGACIGEGMWLPVILATAYALLYLLSHLWVSHIDD